MTVVVFVWIELMTVYYYFDLIVGKAYLYGFEDAAKNQNENQIQMYR